jgi:hypothetical protein
MFYDCGCAKAIFAQIEAQAFVFAQLLQFLSLRRNAMYASAMITWGAEDTLAASVIDDMMWNLRTWPLELLSWATVNSHRLVRLLFRLKCTACVVNRVRHSVAIYGQLLLFRDQSMREKAWRSRKRGAQAT